MSCQGVCSAIPSTQLGLLWVLHKKILKVNILRKVPKTIRKYHFPEICAQIKKVEENKLGLKLNFTLESKWAGLNFEF